MSKNPPVSEVHPLQVSGDFSVLISASKLAEILDVSTRTLWRLRATGKLPQPVRLGGCVRWRAEEVQAWIDAGCPAIVR